MSSSAIDISSGLVPAADPSQGQGVDISAGLQPKDQASGPEGFSLSDLGKAFLGATPVVGPFLYGPGGTPVTNADRMNQLKTDAIAAGATIAPELLPAAEGSGLLPFLGRVLGRSAAAGAGAGVGNMAGQAASGQNPVSPSNLAQTGTIAGTTAALGAPFEAVGDLASAKFGRGLINRSLGASARDVMFGNPAKAITGEGITAAGTGDLEAYKDALRAGKSPADAAAQAGGRFSQVSQRINQIAPQVSSALVNSPVQISVKDAIDAPLMDAATDIINNRAMTDPEKMTALNQLGALQQSLKEGLGDTITPLQANSIKQQIGDRVNWGGTTAVTDQVKPAYRQVYASLNNQVTNAVPSVAQLNERLTNLYAARSDLSSLMRKEEVQGGPGMTSGGLRSVLGRVESEAGRILPWGSNAAQAAGPVVRGAGTVPLSAILSGNWPNQ